MILIDIWISSAEIRRRVEHETINLAKIYQSQGQGHLMDSIILDQDQLLIFRTFFKEAIETVNDKCSPYIRQNTIQRGEEYENTTKLDEDFYTILNMPDTFAQQATSGIDRAIYNYLVSWVIYRWLEAKLPNEAQTFKQRADKNLENLSMRLERRIKPLRRPYRLF